ncbi:MAG: UvrB/UvrC motif-containing protein [Clostridia bacterium]|nr:UvrB/UvrC motif-containing protein [Clostridia bacterium]
MKCQSCGKKEANVRYYESINGKKKEILLCSECAKNLGFTDFSSMFSPIFVNIPEYIDNKSEYLKCIKCGYLFDEYTKTGLFGCPECYTSFRDRLDKILIKLHGKNKHVNASLKSKPSTKSTSNISELDKLKEELQNYIKNEEYEKAAVIRDKIRKLEK